MSTPEQYFATLPADELGPELKSRIEEFTLYVKSFGIYDMWANSYQQYFCSSLSAGSIIATGEEGEYSLLKVNHYRNILQNILVLTTQQQPAYDCIATNDDHKSEAQAEIGDVLLEYYLKEKSLGKYLRQAVEYSLWAGEGFMTVEWQTTGTGETSKNPQTGETINEGDLKFMAHAPFDVIRDYHATDVEYGKDWYIIRSWKNKWDLMAKYPEHADAIFAVGEDVQDWLKYDNWNTRFNREHADQIPFYTFYHRPSEALEKGRMTQFVSDDCILFDGPLPYQKSPVYRVAGSNLTSTIFGYSVAYDLLPIQEALNDLHATILTNQLTFGVQNILMPQGSNIPPQAFVKGLNIINFNKDNGKPEALNLTSTPAEIFKYAESLVGDMQTISGINSVVRGNPEASLKSGSALALVQSQAIQFNSGIQAAYVGLSEAVGAAIIDILRLFASVPKIATIAGKAMAPLMNEFKADDLSQINRVTVDLGNALSQTVAGRISIAQDLLTNKLITTPQEYLEVQETGNLEPLLDAPNAELLLIKNENELLSQGDPQGQVLATMYDDHALHFKEHKSIQSSVEARNNPKLMQALLKHMQQHQDLMKNMDPIVAYLLGEQTPPPQAPPQGAPGAAPPTAPNGATSLVPIDGSIPAVQQQAAAVNMPNMPKPLVKGQPIPANPNKIQAPPPQH